MFSFRRKSNTQASAVASQARVNDDLYAGYDGAKTTAAAVQASAPAVPSSKSGAFKATSNASQPAAKESNAITSRFSFFRRKPAQTQQQPAPAAPPPVTASRQVPATARAMDSNVASMARPMTSMRGAGFTRAGRPGTMAGNANGATSTTANNGAGFESYSARVAASEKIDDPALEEIKQLEKRINQLVKESALAYSDRKSAVALEKAKEAAKKERLLTQQRQQANLTDQINLDLTFTVLLNLAFQYEQHRLYAEALGAYSLLVKNKMFSQAGRLRVNMGNIYFIQNKYTQAIKMYRMALDQVPNTNKEMRFKIMRNIGNAFVKIGQFQDAITSYEAIMESCPDYQSGFNLIFCYYALGDRDKMKRGFQKLTMVRPPLIEHYTDTTSSSDRPDGHVADHEVFKQDALRDLALKRRKVVERYVILVSKLIAPSIESVFSAGYDWVVEQIKTSPLQEIAAELEIAKAIHFLRAKDYTQAIETLKAFEKQDIKVVGVAATNLSFLYLLEGEIRLAEKYADLAVNADRYNAKALNNKGNTYFAREQFTQARKIYEEAISVDAICVEPIYNLGLCLKRSNQYRDALQQFEKVHSILRSNADVIYQIADLHAKLGDLSQSMEWLNILISLVPTDPGVLARFANLHANDNDRAQAFHYYTEAFRYFPSNLDVITWLGGYYVECEVYEQAIQFFERAAVIQPNVAKWQMMVASCHRRSGNYQTAFDCYKRIHSKFPQNIECLKFLVRICADLGLQNDSNDYAVKLTKAEKGIPDEPEAVLDPEATSIGAENDESTTNKGSILKKQVSNKEIFRGDSFSMKPPPTSRGNAPTFEDTDDINALLPD